MATIVPISPTARRSGPSRLLPPIAHIRPDAVPRSRSLAGVGIVLTPDDPYAVIDFERCRDPATGIRIWLRSEAVTLPDVTTDRHAERTEVISDGCWVPVTGHLLFDHPRARELCTIEECDEELGALSRELVGHELPLISRPLVGARDEALSA